MTASTTGNGRRRKAAQPLKQYETPAWCVEQLLRFMPRLVCHPVVEPCCGSGRIVRALLAGGVPTVVAADLELPENNFSCQQADICDPVAQDRLRRSFEDPSLVTNPPYAEALYAALRGPWKEYRRGALLLRFTADEYIPARSAFLDRIYMMISLPRVTWLRRDAPDEGPYTRAHTTGKDNCHSAWFCWDDDAFPKGHRPDHKILYRVRPRDIQQVTARR